jgi:hypothetical protein
MKEALFFGGLAIAGVSTVAGELLPLAPSAIQTNSILQPVGTWIINNQTILTLIGLVLIFLSIIV